MAGSNQYVIPIDLNSKFPPLSSFTKSRISAVVGFLFLSTLIIFVICPNRLPNTIFVLYVMVYFIILLLSEGQSCYSSSTTSISDTRRQTFFRFFFKEPVTKTCLLTIGPTTSSSISGTVSNVAYVPSSNLRVSQFLSR